MDPKLPNSSGNVSSVRNIAISRRGGVRTRGGRIPPVNLRELTQPTASKKIVVPNIPQRRKAIKTEMDAPIKLITKVEKSTPTENSRGRGRRQKVFLQTGGSFLAEGPAARIKKDPLSDETYSIPRASSRKAATQSFEANVDPETIRALVESYDANEAYEDDLDSKPPFRLPLQKTTMIHKIKQEPDDEDDNKHEIKKELVEDIETGIKKEIKKVDDDHTSKKDSILFKEGTDVKPKMNAAEEFQNIKDDGILILLQLPLLSATLEADNTENTPKNKEKKSEKDSEPKVETTFIDTLGEGFIGKLKIMKSGRIKIALGSVEFELREGIQSESYWEAVTIQAHGKDGDIAVLGKVEKKMSLTLVTEDLLMQENVKRSDN